MVLRPEVALTLPITAAIPLCSYTESAASARYAIARSSPSVAVVLVVLVVTGDDTVSDAEPARPYDGPPAAGSLFNAGMNAAGCCSPAPVSIIPSNGPVPVPSVVLLHAWLFVVLVLLAVVLLAVVRGVAVLTPFPFPLPFPSKMSDATVSNTMACWLATASLSSR